MKLLARLFLVAGLMISIGLHWNVLQIVAWVNMLQEYTAQQGLVKGTLMTFDAEHPCSMCKQIAASKDKDQKETQSKTDKQDKSVTWISELCVVNVISDLWENSDLEFGNPLDELQASQWISSPPTPPPRRSEGYV